MQEKSLCEILGIVRRITTTASKSVQRIPIEPAQLRQSLFACSGIALRRDNDDAPPRSMKSRGFVHYCTLFQFHWVSPMKIRLVDSDRILLNFQIEEITQL